MPHTQGKWEIGNGHIFRPASHGSISPYWQQICSFVNNGTEECKLNARLIAAAPDLLEAINNLIYGTRMTINFENLEDQHKYHEAIRAAKEAIKKATTL